MAVTPPPTITPPGLSPDRSDRATFAARSIARDDYIKNVQVPQLTAALANVFANATDAATSAANAQQISISNIYRGPLASDPATRVGGFPNLAGDEYFNTTSNLLKRFNGSTWQASDITTANLAASSGSSLVGHIASFAGSVATTISEFLSRITSLGNGNPAHSDGTNTLTGSPRWFLGNNTPSADDSALLIGRGLSGSYATGSHGVRDESTFLFSGTGLGGYCSFDSIPTSNGTLHYNHLHSYQARPTYNGAGLMDQMAGIVVNFNHTGTGTITNAYGMRYSDPQGTGPIGFQAALWVDPLTRAASNFAIYSASTAVGSYHGGLMEFGTTIRISGSGFTAYGSFISHDGSGNLLSNPQLSIINGVITMSASVAKVLASAATLQLDSSVGVVQVGGMASAQIVAKQKAGAFVASDVPSGQFMLGRDTSGLTTKMYYNNGGTLQSVALA